MAISLSKSLLGVEGKLDAMQFKWADNSVDNGDPMAFMDLGDTAPDNRYAFVYKCEDYTNRTIPTTTLLTDATTATQNGNNIPRPEGEVNITLKPAIVDVLYDLSNVKPGVYVQNTPLAEQFELAVGTSASNVQVRKGDNFNYLRMTGVTDLRTWNDVEGSYEFAADVHMVDYGNSAIYIRGEMPGAYTPINPANSSINQVFNYYEWDWYRENGGGKYGGSSSAGSGIGIYPEENRITIRIKRHATDGLGVASASYSFPYSGKFTPNEDGWFKLRVIDDGETVSIYMNDALMCTIKLENPGVVYEKDGTGQEYYGKATLFDASGKQVLEVENTRLNSQGSQIALTTRFQTMEFANLYIAYEIQVAEGGKIDTALTPSTEQIAYTPDTRLLSSLNMGSAPAETETEVETETNVDVLYGEEPEKKGCKAAFAAPVAMIALIAFAFVSKKKK